MPCWGRKEGGRKEGGGRRERWWEEEVGRKEGGRKEGGGRREEGEREGEGEGEVGVQQSITDCMLKLVDDVILTCQSWAVFQAATETT